MRPTGVPRLVRLVAGGGGMGACGPWEVRKKSPSCGAIVTCVLPVLCVFLQCLAHYSMNPYPRVSDAVQARADAVRALKQPKTSLADQYGANKGL